MVLEAFDYSKVISLGIISGLDDSVALGRFIGGPETQPSQDAKDDDGGLARRLYEKGAALLKAFAFDCEGRCESENLGFDWRVIKHTAT